MTFGSEWVGWPFYPSILFGTALVGTGYLYSVLVARPRFSDSRPVSRGHVASFLGGLAVILLALQTPLDGLSDEYLFTAHMVQHLLVSLVAPPLLLYGTPDWLVRPPFRRWPVLLTVLRGLTNPLAAFILFNAVFVSYHLPIVYDAALESESLHALIHMLLIGVGIIAWWPILGVLPEAPRLPHPLQMLYLFLQTLPQQILGAVFTFATTVLYARYAEAPRLWQSLSARSDQEIGGLIMWVGGSTFFLFAFALVFFRWAAENEAADRPGARAAQS